MEFKKTVVWLVGEPGAGKTTLARALLGSSLHLVDKPKWTKAGTWCAAGHYSGGPFDGADTVPYNGAAEALVYWEQNLKEGHPYTLLDGDRFSNENSVKFFQGHPGFRLACVYLDLPEEKAAARRAARSETVQNPTWVAGRRTKARRFHEGFVDSLRVDGEAPTPEQVQRVLAYLAAPPPPPPSDSDGILGFF